MITRLSSGFRFGMQSGLSFAMNFGLTVLLHESIGLREEIAFAVVLAFTTVMNFLLLRYFVYPGSQGHFLKQFGLFAISSLGFRCVEYSLFLLFHTYLGFAYRPVIVGTLLGTFVLKFFYYGTVVFSGRRTSLLPQAGSSQAASSVG